MWRESDTCPWWYADLQRNAHRRFWTESYGEDFYDWYEQIQVESAKESGDRVPLPIQLSLPGLSPIWTHRDSYLIDSF